MTAGDRATVSSCAGIIAFVLTYIGVDYAKLPRLTYHQLDGGFWRFEVPPPGLPSGFVGQCLWAVVAGAVVGAAAWAVAGRRDKPLSERAGNLSLAWTVTAVLLGLGYFTWNNLP